MPADNANTCQLRAGQVDAERRARGGTVLHGLEPTSEGAVPQRNHAQTTITNITARNTT